ncbi:MAG: Smr/MutS family protein [Vicinamibacterales bacterium]
MQSSVLRTLEFDRVREALSREVSTPLGRVRAVTLEPSGDPAEVRARLDATVEAVEFTRSGSMDLDAPDSLADALGVLDIEDQPLDPAQLFGLARFVDSVERVADRIRGTDLPVPRLGAIARRAVSFADETAAVRRAIEPSGEVSDHASPALRDIRESLRRQRAKLRSTLEGLARGRDSAKYLQDQIVTDRNGRYVVVVRAEHRDAIPGIVHGSSTSGASLYLEPLSTVGLNNDVVALAEREREEIRRILLALTNAFRLRADDLEATLDVAADLDELQAKARFARRVDGVAPELATDGRVEFRGARHPLLIPAVRDLLDGDPDAGPKAPVPSDLLVMPPTRALVISGPNTGGKTVALKAIGLLSLMAQAGLLIPAEPGSQCTVFRSVFADIGDEQSIQASLSTFSARIANLVAMERALEAPALVLLDEVGSGTDPVEGGALGTAVIDHFRRRGATIVATTHDDALKSYAATTDGVATGAFGFNAETFAPTYRLVYGAPGRSLAIEIAQRLGMPAAVIADARNRRTGRESQLAAHLARVDQELASLQQSRDALETDRRALAAERRALLDREARLTEREAIIRRRSDDKLNEKLREARAEVDRIVGQLKEKAGVLATRAERARAGGAPGVATGDIGQLRAGARAALGALGEQAGSGMTGDARPLAGPPAMGQRVFVPALGAAGAVAGVSGQRVEVDVRGKRIRVRLDELREAPPGAGSSPQAGQPEAGGGRRSGRNRGGRAPGASGHPAARPESLVQTTRELVVVGATVDEAVGRVEKFIDDALLADERRLRIVHGRGTGRLREGLKAFLRDHPVVSAVLPAADDEGGDAATIVELRD